MKTTHESYRLGRRVIPVEVTHCRNTYGCDDVADWGCVLYMPMGALRDDILGGKGLRPNLVDLRLTKGILTSGSCD